MNQHTAMMHARCPVNGAWDYYRVTVFSAEVIEVERIDAALNDVRGTCAYQEDITARLSASLACRVRLEGRHGTFDSVTEAD